MEMSDHESSGQLIRQLTRQISRWKLTLPAILFLEVTKPLSFIASQGLLLCEPVLGFFYEEPRIAQYADLLSDRTNIDHLVACLEGDAAIGMDDGKGRG